MHVNLEDCKRFCGVIGSDDDVVMQLCMESAQEYITASGVPETASGSSAYVLCLYRLAAHYFDNRSAIGDSVERPVPPGVVSAIMQLKHAKTEAAYGH